MSENTTEVASAIDDGSVVVETPPSSVDDSKVGASNLEQEQASDKTEIAEELPKVSFPRLGNSSTPVSTSTAWGSALKTNARAASPGVAKPMRSKNVQEVFSLDLETQYEITKSEFSSIVQTIKQKFDVSVESTLSKTSRTFLISGASDKIGLARRELVKKLTKPITLNLDIPSKTRSAIIGSGGKTIRSISDSTGVKIVVPKEVDEDTYDKDLEDYNVSISLHGDAESVTMAKKKILEIVKEETKNARIVVPLEDPKLIPFIELSNIEIPSEVKAQLHQQSKEVILNGPREEVKLAKVKVINYLNELGIKIVVKKEKVPSKFRNLINPEELKEKFQVVVQAPEVGDDYFTFTGVTEKVEEAIVYAKNSSKYYNVDSLEISKAHGKNVQHGKNLVLYFSKYQVLQAIQSKYPDVRIVLPNIMNLKSLDSVVITLIAKNEFSDEIKSARKEIVSLVNEISPEQVLSVSDIDYKLFHKDIKQILLATEDEVPFVQLGDYYNGSDDILLITKVDEDDFKPSEDELKAKLESVNEQLDSLRKKQQALASKVIYMPESQQSKLFGQSKVTLKLINEAVSHANGNVLIKPNSPSKDEITVRGDEQGCKIAVSAIESIIKAPAVDYKLSFSVPTTVVSRLIGPKGANLQQLREHFDIQIFIPQDVKEESTEVTLTGLEYSVTLAKAHILADSKKWADIVTKELVVPTRFIRSLIGSQGAYRIRLENKYSVYIKFPKDGEIVTIKGPSRGVKGAYDELKALLDFEIENGHKELIEVPIGYVNRVIGKSGETINDIKAEYGVELNFLDKSDSEKAKEDGFIELEITGSRNNIKEAAKKVNSIVEQASNFVTVTLEDINPKWFSDIIGRGGSQLKEIISKAGGDDIRMKRVDIPNSHSESKVISIEGPSEFVEKVSRSIKKIAAELENSVSKELNIPSDKYGALIGPGGTVRRDLEAEFKVRINVPNKDTTGKVTIIGSPTNIEACEKKISNDIVKSNYDLEILIPSQYHSYVSEGALFIQKLRSEFSIDVSHGNSSRLAHSSSRPKFTVPDGIAGSGEDKFNVVIQKVVDKNSNSINIPWRLTYSPIDLSDVLGEEYNSEAESKESVLAKVSKLIEDRLEEAKKIDTEAFIWAKDHSKFNAVVGPSGRTVKGIRNKTKTIIQVPRKTDKTNDVIYVKGSEEGVKEACDLITKALK